MQARGLRQGDIRLDPKPSNHPIHNVFLARLGLHESVLVTRFDSRNRFAGQYLNTLLTIELAQEGSQIGGIDVAANCLAWKYHHNFPAVYGEGSGDLPSDKSSSNYSETPAALRQTAQPLVVVQSTIVDGAAVTGR